MLYCTQYNQAYHDYIVRCDALDAKIEIKQKQQGRLSAQIAQLKKQKRALVFPNWIDSVLRPLAKDLEAYLDKPVNVAGSLRTACRSFVACLRQPGNAGSFRIPQSDNRSGFQQGNAGITLRHRPRRPRMSARIHRRPQPYWQRNTTAS